MALTLWYFEKYYFYLCDKDKKQIKRKEKKKKEKEQLQEDPHILKALVRGKWKKTYASSLPTGTGMTEHTKYSWPGLLWCTSCSRNSYEKASSCTMIGSQDHTKGFFNSNPMSFQLTSINRPMSFKLKYQKFHAFLQTYLKQRFSLGITTHTFNMKYYIW